ncbi:MAG: beta strand repeat-containing protein [Candidatus Spyradenecus sp.]
MKRFLKSFLSVMAVALTSWTWAAAEVTYDWTSKNANQLYNFTNELIIPESVTSFDVTVTYSGGWKRIEIAGMKLFDQAGNEILGVTTGTGASFVGGSKNNNVYTFGRSEGFSNSTYTLSAVFWVDGTDHAGKMTLSNGVTFNGDLSVTQTGSITMPAQRLQGNEGGITIPSNFDLTVEGDVNGAAVSKNIVVSGTLCAKSGLTFTGGLSGAGQIVAEGTGSELDLTSATVTNFKGTYAVTDGATLILKKAQAEAGVTVDADATLKVKVDSYEAVDLTTSVTLDGGNHVVFVLPSGKEVIGTGATMPKQSVYTYTAKVGAGNNWSIKENWQLDGVAVDAVPSGTVTTSVKVVLPGATTLTMDVADVTLSALSVSGGDLTIAGENALTVKTVATANKVVVSGKLILEAGTKAAPTEMANVFEVAEGGTLTTKGYLNLTAANQVNSGGALEVASDVTTFNAAEQGIKGMLTIDKEATFKNGTNDALAYGTDGVVVNVYGTLDMGATRWTIFAKNNTINAYAGATITGVGQSNNGALDVWEKDTNTEDHVAINVLKNGEDASEVTISATIRYREKETIFNIAEGMTANLTGTNADVNTIDGGLKVKGSGTLKLSGKYAYANGVGVTVESDAMLIVAHAEALSTPVTNDGKITYTIDATPTNTITNNGTIAADGAGTEVNLTGATLSGSGTYAVTNGATIKLPYAATVDKTLSADATSKFIVVLNNDETDQNDLSAVTVTGTGTLQFVDEAGNALPSSGSTYVLPTYTVTAEGGSWNVAPLQNTKVVIDFAGTEGKTVDLATILGNVTALSKLTVKGTNGGTITKTGDGAVTATTLTIDAPLSLGGTGEIKVTDNIYCNADFYAPVERLNSDNGGHTITIAKGKTFEVNTVNTNTAIGRTVKIVGPGTFKKSGTGQLNLFTNVGVDSKGVLLDSLIVEVSEGKLNLTKWGETTNDPIVKATQFNLSNRVEILNSDKLTCQGETVLQVGENSTANAFTSGKGVVFNNSFTISGGGNLTIPANLSGNGTLTVSSGTLTLTAANTYTGGTEIAKGATLEVATRAPEKIDANTPKSFTNGTVIMNNGTLKLTSGYAYLKVGGLGETVIPGSDFVFGVVDNPQDTFANALTVNEGATFRVRAWGEDTFAITTLTLNGEMTQEGGNTTVKATVSGPATLKTLGTNVNLTLNGTLTDSSNAFAIGNGSCLTLNLSEKKTIANCFSGSGNLVIGDGAKAVTVALTGLNEGYSGTITVAAKATLSNGSSTATVPFGKGSIVNNGALKLTGPAAEASKDYAQLPPVSGTGDITFCSSSATRIAGAITTTGKVTIEGKQKATLEDRTIVTLPAAVVVFGRDSRDFKNTSASIEGPSIAIGAGATLARSDEASSVTIANGTTLSGTGTPVGTDTTGTIGVPITFAAGSVLDATSKVGIVVTDTVTGTVNVKVKTAKGVLSTKGDVLKRSQLAFADDTESQALKRAGYRFVESLIGSGESVIHDFKVMAKVDVSEISTVVNDNDDVLNIIYNAVANDSSISKVTNVTAMSADFVTKPTTSSSDALALFENLYALATSGNELTDENGIGTGTYEGTVTVYYDFGISQLHVKRAALNGEESAPLYVLLCAKVESVGMAPADYASGTTVTLYKGDTPVDKPLTPTNDQLAVLGITPAAGEKWFAVPMAELDTGTNAFTVKATNTTH